MPTVIHKKNPARRLSAVVAVVIAVLLAVGGGFLWSQYQTQQAAQKFSQLKSTTDAMEATGHFAQAADTWANYARDSKNPKNYRDKAWQNAGLMYVTSANYSKGLTSFQNSVAISGINYTKATELATAAARSGNKSLAIQYYQKALDLMPSDMPARGEQINLFKSDIEQLKQGGL